MKYLLVTVLALISHNLFAQTYTAKQLYDEYNQNSYNFENKYFNKTLTIKGKIRSISVGTKGWNQYHNVYITATGYENFIVCQFPVEDTVTLGQLKAGETVMVTGDYNQKNRDAIFLRNSRFIKTKEPAKPTKAAPAQLPLGTYHVYQSNGASFNFQYKLILNSYSSYTINNKKGTCSCDSKKKVIRFISGALKGFAGIYRPTNPENEKDPPTIVIDFNGSVPDLAKQVGKMYLYAYLQP